jgi:uncharacterized protein (TIGR03067 family)
MKGEGVMRTRLCVALVAMIALPAFAPIPFPKPNKKKASLQGTWNMEQQGRTIDKGGAVRSFRMKVHIEGELWTFLRVDDQGGSRPAVKYTIVLDAKKDPKWLDLKRTPDAEPTIKGIYKIEGDTLTIWYVTRMGNRPTSFTDTTGRQVVMVLKRDKL